MPFWYVHTIQSQRTSAGVNVIQPRLAITETYVQLLDLRCFLLQDDMWQYDNAWNGSRYVPLQCQTTLAGVYIEFNKVGDP